MKLIVLFVCAFSSAHGQVSQKIGHADWEFIFSQLPEYKQVETELTTFESQLQNELKIKTQEFEAKYTAYQQLPATTPEAIKRDKESELQYLESNLQKFQQNASLSLQQKQQELITPIFKKVGKAIEDVATEQGYDYIVNPQLIGGGDILLYANEKYNISNLVLKKLGVANTN